MNKLEGHITEVETNGSLSLVSASVSGGRIFKAIVIENPETATYLKHGIKIGLLFKETEVILSTTENAGVSLQNKIPGTIQNIETGKLLSRIELETQAGTIVALISSSAVQELGLKEGVEVVAMVKLNEIMLSET
ncbi:TOBE domain-containing protein [Poritiphilus flavus]|uniref:Tobe domain protein n=1 Tax=Poritiphilus flavus TaxID=2697053 RepID=A0A6L9E9L5_9FLAO|nr:TOBE domain-containing protein [Poritiphilus flavus]NAS11238.1 tobe domain protein [Poritiphilus flavus]